MILANVIFGTGRGAERETLEDLAESYLGTLAQLGHLCGPWFLTWTNGRLNAHILLAAAAALEPRHHTKRGKEDLKAVTTAFGKSPVWKILDDDANVRPSTCKGAPFLYLFTHAFDWASPVFRGDGKKPVPVFSLPLSEQQKSDLYSWQNGYSDHDKIWIGSGKLEVPAYRQLADPESDLAASGRDLCREIESATGVPTFYYLMRYWGRSRCEDRRPCPGCGKEWQAGRNEGSTSHFWHLDFKCDSCRLVSHRGDTTGGGRLVRIGEFGAKRRQS